ncbi:MAG TPA: hypothetical protein DCW44_02920 [Eubacterium sp.]|nr:hypothetical protein [Eubacterium sp.]
MSKSIQLKKQNENVYPHPYYPVGSIYLSVVNTNPSIWFGGTWEQIAKGRTLVGVDTSDTDFNTVKKTGGSKQIQKHSHTLFETKYNYTTGGQPTANSVVLAGSNATSPSVKTDDYGSGNSGNLQPYFTCYIWCRTA